MNVKSYANNNQLAIMPDERVQVCNVETLASALRQTCFSLALGFSQLPECVSKPNFADFTFAVWQVLEWSRRYLAVLAVANNRLYQLRLQVPERAVANELEFLRQVMNSFQVYELL